MLLRIDSCGECPAKDGDFESYDKSEYLLDCKLSRKKSREAENGVIPSWCPLREQEVDINSLDELGAFMKECLVIAERIKDDTRPCGTCEGEEFVPVDDTPVELKPCPDCQGGKP